MVIRGDQGVGDPGDILETDDYEGLVPFFIENGLEFSEEDDTPVDLVKCWKAEDEFGALAGACVLARRDGEFICDGIAVARAFRAKGLGGKLLDVLIAEVARRGGRRLYLVARAPDFFAKNGFVATDREDAPNFFECFACPQYEKTCFPKVMRLEFEDTGIS
ncbi:MAG: GNAT family N-acetyltransferase [Clostridiales Family XIII bacterium]|jgi:N-acetylglutamate synthase-like GNAT family acetyltransferase|nr:GNAT family N-acetyltransferase [Clostridiales Family XIII bacterium]